MEIINGERKLGDLCAAHKTKASFNKAMRMDAKCRLAKSDRALQCAVCGSKEKLDVHHIRSICCFDDAVKIKTINAPSNLEYLCKEHHMEKHFGHSTQAR